jgi:hypothetical protein
VFLRGSANLNTVTVQNSYPYSHKADTLSYLEGATIFSRMNLQSGYHQVPVTITDRSKTAFITADGLYQFRALPFRLTNDSGTLQWTKDIIFAGIQWITCLIYLDDIIVYSAKFKQHLKRLSLVMDCCSKADLKLKWSKC